MNEFEFIQKGVRIRFDVKEEEFYAQTPKGQIRDKSLRKVREGINKAIKQKLSIKAYHRGHNNDNYEIVTITSLSGDEVWYLAPGEKAPRRSYIYAWNELNFFEHSGANTALIEQMTKQRIIIKNAQAALVRLDKAMVKVSLPKKGKDAR